MIQIIQKILVLIFIKFIHNQHCNWNGENTAAIVFIANLETGN